MTGHTDEIVKAAEAVARCYERGTKNYSDTTLESYFDATLYEIALRDLARAVAAKREAEKPKPTRLDAVEAECIYWAQPVEASAKWQAVLDAAHRKAFEVIKAKARIIDEGEGRGHDEVVSLDDISHALGITEERHG